MEELYNERRKTSFINEGGFKPSVANSARRIFIWYADMERSLDMDLCEWPAEVLEPFVNSQSGLRSKSVSVVLTILKKYIRWCEDNGYKTSDAIRRIRIDAYEKIRSQMIPNPYALRKKLDEHFDLPEEETVDIVYRVYLWMAFAGIEDEDAILVRDVDVNFRKMTITSDLKSYEIYRDALDDFYAACNLREFRYVHTDPDYTTMRDRVEGNTIVRGLKSNTDNLMSIRPVINKKLRYNKEERLRQREREKHLKALKKEAASANKQIEIVNVEEPSGKQVNTMSYDRIRLSGLFYRAFVREQAGEKPDFSQFITAQIARKEKPYKYTQSRTEATVINQFQREYMTDYENWKSAFFVLFSDND